MVAVLDFTNDRLTRGVPPWGGVVEGRKLTVNVKGFCCVSNLAVAIKGIAPPLLTKKILRNGESNPGYLSDSEEY